MFLNFIPIFKWIHWRQFIISKINFYKIWYFINQNLKSYYNEFWLQFDKKTAIHTIIKDSKEFFYHSAIAIAYSIFTTKSKSNSKQLTSWKIQLFKNLFFSKYTVSIQGVSFSEFDSNLVVNILFAIAESF